MVYDPATRQLVLFGGDTFASGTTTPLNDTWVWNGTTWSQMSPGASPSARQFPAIAYDSASRKLVLLGGLTAGFAALNDTWTWDGSTWTQQSPATSPPAMTRPAIAPDPSSGRIVLTGGFGSGSLNDNWTWTGTTWAHLSPAVSPSARFGEPLVPNPATGRLLLFGGFDGQARNDTWSYRVTVAPAPGTPGTPVAVAGSTQATVTVTAPSTGGTPTSYTVTAVDSTALGRGGQTCTVSGASGACTLTGLTNGDSYTFTSTATGAGGTSAASAASNAVVPRAPAPILPPPPVAASMSSSGTGAQSVTLTVPAGGLATLVDGASPVEVAVAGQGTYALAEAVLTFTPVGGFIGTATPVIYQLTDTYGQSSRGTYQPVVTGTTGAQPADRSGGKGEQQTFTPLVGFLAPAGEQLVPGSLRITDPNTGNARLNVTTRSGTWRASTTTGAITFTPATNFVGVTTMTYSVRTASGLSITSDTDERVHTSTVSATVTGTARYSAKATILFPAGSARITALAERTIATLTAKVDGAGTDRVVTVSYPHPAGSTADHRALSRARAKATAKAVTAGLGPARVTLKSRATRRGDGTAARSVTIAVAWTLTQE